MDTKWNLLKKFPNLLCKTYLVQNPLPQFHSESTNKNPNILLQFTTEAWDPFVEGKMSNPPNSSASSSSQFTYSNNNGSYFPMPFHLQQPQTYPAAAPPPPPSVVQFPAPPPAYATPSTSVPGVYFPQFQQVISVNPN